MRSDEKSADADLLREMIGLAAEPLEVILATGAEFDEQNPLRPQIEQTRVGADADGRRLRSAPHPERLRVPRGRSFEDGPRVNSGKGETMKRDDAVKQPDGIDLEVGRRLRLQRKLLGMSQLGLASGLGISFQQVQKYERGANRIGASRLAQIANILKVDVSYFFSDTRVIGDIGADAGDITSFVATPEGVSLNRSFQKIPNAQTRKSLVSLIRAIAEDDR
ncbi:helix-turn-helix transcriptional regulator [Rhizobium sp. BR 318]|uniref:Transcriptional regulator with XRE-family HTH domain n=2 Tax=Rhizobium/Agrobacterium group TaxID=227290 RepID=A0A7W8XYY4_9HYPH|nr:helix-turn-helix transcriptional regulator [Rhizobium paranaense]MBB5577935.1 transcriptional regulator with XRE-family HTH domain [Rhizobium paranaense]